ncbi:MAG TPA: YciI family protein [Candidatus Angelobacter sp.]|nr:YciI family protein [Candidatus Angelobacter sp.]
MEYLLLIYQADSQREALNGPEEEKVYQQYYELIQELTKEGKYKGGHELQPTAMASTVRVRNNRQAVTDGPFAETKEQLGGYFLIDVNNLDEALAIAARIPTAKTGCIEVRPIVEGH